jgi:hypothetical protein
MFTPKNTNALVIAIGLLFITIVTRGSHFGNAALLPDATLAALFLGGILLRRVGWLALLLAAAFLSDAWAVNFQNVSSFCITPAYLGLIPSYSLAWLGGRLLQSSGNFFSIARFTVAGFISASLAFCLSNVFWYLFSGYFGQMEVTQFAAAVSKYYLSYVGYTLLYLAFAWAMRHLYLSVKNPARQPA